MKNIVKKIFAAALAATMLLTASCAGGGNGPDSGTDVTDSKGSTGTETTGASTETDMETEDPNAVFKLKSPENGATVTNATLRMQDYMAHVDEYYKYEWRRVKGIANKDLSAPAPVVLEWEGGPGLLTVTDGNGETVVSGEYESGYELYNLYLGMTYTWSVGDSSRRRFTVTDVQPRWMFVEGTFNVRDMGGWKTRDGRTVKQGLLYRGCEFEPFYELTERGIDALHNDLKLKTEIDLRLESAENGKSESVVEGIDYMLCPVHAYAEYISLDSEMCKQLFDSFADPDIYPAYFHCMAGADRTGTVAFLLLALLGVEEESIYADYELTNLSNFNHRSRTSPEFRSLIIGIAKYGGKDIYEQTENYLRSCGVTDETMNKIRDLFLES